MPSYLIWDLVSYLTPLISSSFKDSNQFQNFMLTKIKSPRKITTCSMFLNMITVGGWGGRKKGRK